MPPGTASLPGDLAAAHAMILLERAARLEAEAAVSGARPEIERLKLLLAKARRERYGQSSERAARLVERLKIAAALRAHEGNKTRAAEELGVSYKTLLTKIKEYDL